MSRYSLLLGCLLLTAPAAAQAPTRWTVDTRTSLAWWQMSPNLGHLWATTCPGDSSWRPGEGRSSGWTISKSLKMPASGDASVDDTVHVPLFPRHQVNATCVEAVRGEVVAPDTVHWRGTRASLLVDGNAFVTGERARDMLMHQVMQTAQFPDIAFALDSVTNMTKQADTLHGTAFGVLTFRDIKMPTTAAVQAFHDRGGMRVTGKWRVKARELKTMAPKLHYLGLGVNTNIWHDFFMGFDIVFRPESAGAGSRGNN